MHPAKPAKRVILRRLPAALVALAALAGPVRAQMEHDWDQAEEEHLSDRKRPGIFYRPAEDGPAEQLARARRFEQEGRLRAAGRACQTLVHAWHGSAEAAEAQMLLGEILERRNRYAAAFEEYQYLADNFAGRFPFDEVIERQYRIANHVMGLRRGRFGPFRGIAFPARAVPLFEALVRNAPEWERAAEVRYRLGELYRQSKDFMTAVVVFETLRYRYPGFPRMREADFARAVCMYELARGKPRDENTSRDAISALSGFLLEYPDAPQAAEARAKLDRIKEQLAAMYYARAAFYDKHRRRKPQAALIAYRDFVARFPTSSLAEKARARLERIEAETARDQAVSGEGPGPAVDAADRPAAGADVP